MWKTCAGGVDGGSPGAFGTTAAPGTPALPAFALRSNSVVGKGFRIDDIRLLVNQNASVSLATDRIRFLPDLLSLKMPRLALAPDELVAIRKDGVFNGLRSALSEALRRTAELDEDDAVDPGSARLREIQEFLLTAADDAETEAKRSRVIRSSVSGVAAVGLGCATGALGAVGGIGPAAIAGGVGSGGALLIGWLGGRPISGRRSFRRAVVSIFGSPA